MIRENLPSDSKSIVVVISSPCNDPFSYQINGSDTVYLGVGDLHDGMYESLQYQHKLCGQENCTKAFSMYSGAPLETDTCPFTLTLYPSDAMKSEFTTKNPAVFSVVALSIFLFTSLVFILYDYFVERRQTVVLGTATRSSAIVSSLFPSVVRDQLYPTHSTRADANKERVQSFISATTDSAGASDYQKLVGAPIAELYPDTTVFFADIAGFTSWSSTRSPADVFHLLETLYGGFDEIARHHGVFKVETIGDSYVAVVGLPTPRKHHSVVMARFAQECILRMTMLTQDLAKVLGSVSTLNVGYMYAADLAKLVLHLCHFERTLKIYPCVSGSTLGRPPEAFCVVKRPASSSLVMYVCVYTARLVPSLQFADNCFCCTTTQTVNTAARMESNGAPNRIQVSESTASLIQLSGKGHWLEARIDKVHAKGKGEMQTYWCDPSAQNSGTDIVIGGELVEERTS
jgi:class 3 adenylate cyclase